MDEYPNPDEEFELMYGDDLDALRELEDEDSRFPQTNQPTGRAKASPSLQTATALNGPSTTPSTQVQPTIEPKKRTIQELFGEIDDILNEEIVDGKTVKRTKQEKDDRALINHIVELRKLNRERQSLVISSKNASIGSDRDKHNISYVAPKYLFVTVTGNCGERIYVRCHSEEFERETLKQIGKDTFKGVMGEAFREIWKEAQIELNKTLDTENCDTTMELEHSSVAKTLREGDTSLWVDLYKPQKYYELLSDESTNRTLLQWLKLWDKVVFKRKPKVKVINNNNNTDSRDFLSNFKKLELNTTLDEHGFPEKKVALLCGPPGLGKTTLAHLIAEHAGYNVVEANASDDRTPEKFQELLKTATEMEAVIDPKKRPNCVIFDEIDGAPAAAINFLVKFVTELNVSKKKKGVKTGSKLKRPIICICNDVYVPALRPLRQVAFVVYFPPTVTNRLAERLNVIAKQQEIKIDLGALLALCEKTENDIRSCLSALHFFKSKDKQITTTEVSSTSVGQKDMRKALFSVWQSIFQVERPKLSVNNSCNITLKSRMSNILQTVNNFGDHERLAQGIFENYPTLHTDNSLSSTGEALEWFCYLDILNKHIYTLQNYDLLPYLSYCFVIWHFVFGSAARPKLAYPSVGYEMKVKSTKNFAILSELIKGMQPTIRAYTCPNSLRLDTLPLLSQILVPPFRPVNLHLFTDEEKQTLANVVNIMLDYNLGYEQDKTPEGNYVFNIEPNITELTCFSTSKPARVLSYFNKQLVSRELEVQKIRRAELHKNKGNPEGSDKTKRSPNLPNHLQRLKPKGVNSRGQRPTPVAKDFFGRIIAQPTSANKSGPEMKSDIYYQYKEGFSNAVRRTIKISSLE